MQIVICEDCEVHRTHLESIVKKHREIESGNMVLALVSSSPNEVLAFAERVSLSGRLYLLDIDLQHELDGITLATQIKKIDTSAKIIFVTAHSELAYLTFANKVDTLDYIVKDSPQNVEKNVLECLDKAFKHFNEDNHHNRKVYRVKASGEVWNVAYDDILFFETHTSIRHKIILHMKNSQIEFRGHIGEIAELDEEFFRIHKSYVVNIKHIKRVDKAMRVAEMVNGQTVPITIRKVGDLINALA